MELQPRFLHPPEQSLFLFGPRGTGESSWIDHTHSQALVVDLLKPEVFREMSARPDRLAEPVLVYRGDRRLLIDGILCVPGEEFLRSMKPERGLTDFG